MPSVHLSQIQKLKSDRNARREETADGNSSDLSSDDDDDDDGAFHQNEDAMDQS